jgi:DNA-binding beta-propeller fold protein YncE
MKILKSAFSVAAFLMVAAGGANVVHAASFGGSVPAYSATTRAVGVTPSAVAFDSHTNTIWVANTGNSTVTQINDGTYATSTRQFYYPAWSPSAMAFDPHTNSMWLAGGNAVMQVNDTTYATSTYAVIGANAIAFDSHTNTVWVTNSTKNTVTQINETTHVMSTYAVGTHPDAVVFDPHTNTVWVANYGSYTLTGINDTTYAISTVSQPNHCPPALSSCCLTGPSAVAFDPHNNTIWVLDTLNGAFEEFNDTTLRETMVAGDAGVGPNAFAFDSYDNTMWATNAGSGTVIEAGESLLPFPTTYNTGTKPAAVAFDAHTNTVWVANSGSNTVTQFTPTH